MARDIEKLRILEDEALAYSSRLADSLSRLTQRLHPGELLITGVDRVTELTRDQIDRATDTSIDLAGAVWEKGNAFVRDNRKAIALGAAVTIGSAVCVRHLLKKKTVPIYEAYRMEDPDTLGGRAASRWRKVKDNAQALGSKAGEACGFARAAAHDAVDAVRERAGEAGTAAGRYQRESTAATIVTGLVLGALAGTLLPVSGRSTDAPDAPDSGAAPDAA